MRIPLPIFIAVIILFLSGSSMFHVKYQVQNIRKDIVELKKSIAHEKQSVKVLEAEWAYSNNPKRLMQIVKSYLPKLKPINVANYGYYEKNKNAHIDYMLAAKEAKERLNKAGSPVASASFKH